MMFAPISTSAEAGAAAHYDPSYDDGWWCATLQQYAAWGEVAPGWGCDPHGYWCVKPGYLPGSVLNLYANGVEITCTVGDTVWPDDVAAWEDSWVIELNWDAFVALGLQRNNAVQVEDAPAPAPAEPAQRCFAETGHCIHDGFLAYWNEHGDIRVLGLPLTDEFAAADTGLTTQIFERQILEFAPGDGDWAVRGRRITTPLSQILPLGVEAQ